MFSTVVTSSFGPFAGSFSPGDVAIISYDLDADVLDSNGAADLGLYFNATLSLTFEFPDLGLLTDFAQGNVQTFDNTANPDHQVFIFGLVNQNSSMLGGESIELTELGFTGTTSMLSSDALPSSILSDLTNIVAFFETTSGFTQVNFSTELDFDCHAVATIPTAECEALVALYNSTDGDNWTDNTGWLVLADPCSWFGVICFGGSVVQVRLGANELSGPIPHALGDLSNLEQLVLQGNQLTGTIPPELGNLSNLRWSFLLDNQLTGAIPPELGNLSNLEQLLLGSNQLTGAIPPELGNLSSLTVLSINSNQITGTIPAELGNLSNLDILWLFDSELEGLVPLTVAVLGGQLQQDSPALFPCSFQNAGVFMPDTQEYRDADLDGDGFICEVPLSAPPEFSSSTVTEIPQIECEALVALYNSTDGDNWTKNDGWLLSADMCSPSGVACLGGRVVVISLPINNLTGSIPAELGNLTALTTLQLNDNNLTGSIPAELGNLTALAGLFLESNELSGPIPAELGNLTALMTLYLFGNNLTGSIPAELGNTALRLLLLESNQLSGPIPAELGNLTGLSGLQLNDNNLTGSIPAELGNLTALSGLFLGFNSLTGSIPAELGNLTALDRLFLESNQLSGPIPAELGNLTALRRLILNANDLSGPFPVELGDLTAIRALQFGSNQLTGPIPAELGNLTSLEFFWLHTNELTGLVPLSVAGLGGVLHPERCRFESNPGLFMPDDQDYLDADLDNDGFICGIEVSTPPPEDIADSLEDQIETLEESESLNRGQGNALTGKLGRIEDLIEDGKTKQAANQLRSFINQVTDFVAAGVISEEEGAVLLEQAEILGEQLWSVLESFEDLGRPWPSAGSNLPTPFTFPSGVIMS